MKLKKCKYCSRYWDEDEKEWKVINGSWVRNCEPKDFEAAVCPECSRLEKM